MPRANEDSENKRLPVNQSFQFVPPPPVINPITQVPRPSPPVIETTKITEVPQEQATLLIEPQPIQTSAANTLQDLYYEIGRLSPIIKYINDFPQTESEKIILGNLNLNYANVLRERNTDKIKAYLTQILQELNASLQLRDTQNLNNEINLLQNTVLPLQLSTIINGVLSKFYTAMRVNESWSAPGSIAVSDFSRSDMDLLFKNYNLKRYDIILQFLLNELKSFEPNFQERMLQLLEQPKTQSNFNSEYQLISFFILKYGLNFPPMLHTPLLTIIQSQLDKYRPVIENYIMKNPQDQFTRAEAETVMRMQLPPLNTNENYYYESDIVGNPEAAPSIFGSAVRGYQNIANPIKETTSRILTYGWRNPAATASLLAGTVGGAATIMNALDLSSPTNDYTRYQIRDELANKFADYGTEPLGNTFKTVFKPVVKYTASNAINHGFNALDAATDAVGSVRESVTNFINTVRPDSPVSEGEYNTPLPSPPPRETTFFEDFKNKYLPVIGALGGAYGANAAFRAH